ncbi:MAG: hypothetical protein ACP5HU_12450 [Phycisphaerae bacterium]
MSEQITHIAVADDARLLALNSPRIGGAVREALLNHQDKCRLGAVTRASEEFAGPVVEQLRARADEPRPRDAEKLAFCLGTMAHRSADRMYKPIFRSQSADGSCDRKDISIYHDVFVFRRIYAAGDKEPYRPDALSPTVELPEGAPVDAAELEGLFGVLFQRALLAAHTFKPDLTDPQGWLEKLFDRIQEFTIDIGRYHKALTEPDEDIYRRAITDVNFFDESDSILALLDELREGGEVTGEEFLRRCRLGDKDSLYARAVSGAYGYFQVTSEFWSGRCSAELFADAIRR